MKKNEESLLFSIFWWLEKTSFCEYGTIVHFVKIRRNLKCVAGVVLAFV